MGLLFEKGTTQKRGPIRYPQLPLSLLLLQRSTMIKESSLKSKKRMPRAASRGNPQKSFICKETAPLAMSWTQPKKEKMGNLQCRRQTNPLCVFGIEGFLQGAACGRRGKPSMKKSQHVGGNRPSSAFQKGLFSHRASEGKEGAQIIRVRFRACQCTW